MRSFTKKNIEYSCADAGHSTDDSLHKLLFTDGTGDQIQKMRNEFETPAFKKAANALISLAVQWKKIDWETNNPGMSLVINDIVAVDEIKNIFITIAQKDYVINADHGNIPQHIINNPIAGKSVDFHIIKNTDGVKFTDIDILILQKQFFNAVKIKNILNAPPFDLTNVPNITDDVLENAAILLVLKVVLSIAKLRSGYENLYGFKYPDATNTTKVKLNCFIYRSVVPVTADVLTLLTDAITESKNVFIDSVGTVSEPLKYLTLAMHLTANSFDDFIKNGTKPNRTVIKGYKKKLDGLKSAAGNTYAKDSLSYLIDALDLDQKKFDTKTKKFIEGIKDAKKALTAIGNSNPIQNNTVNLANKLNEIKKAFDNVQTQLEAKVPINSSSFSIKAKVSKFSRVDPAIDILGNLNPLITVLAPNHINFKDVLNVANWTRQGMTNEDAAGLTIIPFNEGEAIVDHYINSNTRDGIKDSTVKQGLLLTNYIKNHYDDHADEGYRYAKSALILRQGLYCAFCETPFITGRNVDIEHKLPKAKFPTQSLNWNNFVLACKVCNSDNKGEKYIDSTSGIVNAKTTYLNAPFGSRATPGTKNYLECRGIAEQEVLWPDKKHAPVSGNNAHELLSFQAIKSTLPIAINLASIQATTNALVFITGPAGAKTYQIDILGLANGIPGDNVSVKFETTAHLPGDVNNIGVEASSKHIISFCGLDKPGASFWNDQRIVSRTKAWLNAMTNLKTLADYNKGKLQYLYKYYQQQLHPVNVKTHGPNGSNIENLRDATSTTIQLDTITGNLSMVIPLPNGKIHLSLTAFPFTGNVAINGAPHGTAVNINDGILTGEITETATGKTITGRIEAGAGIAGIGGKTILFKDAGLNNAPHATITIAAAQGVISQAQLGAAGTPAEILNEWDDKRADLLRIIDQASTVLQDFLWDNMLDMVRFGGFYSTWVQTFQANRAVTATETIPYDIELVQRLEAKALENPEDPFQFHGTDAEEIIACL